MGAGLSSMQAISGSIGAAALSAAKLVGDSRDAKLEKMKKDSGIDMKMAAKARKTYQQKVNAIYANNEISKKAKTRRLGAALDEYAKIMGGKD